jgi:hypothetical protein
MRNDARSLPETDRPGAPLHFRRFLSGRQGAEWFS